MSAAVSTTPPQPQPSKPLVGVAVFLLSPSHPNRFLLGKRLGSHGSGTWALPGGHLELNESFETCTARELREETGLSVDKTKLKFLTTTNDVMPGNKHYVTIFMVGQLSEEDVKSGKEPAVMERDKCEGWEWVNWGEMVEIARAKTATAMEAVGARVEGGREVRKLFQPMSDLLEQRPGIQPSLSMLE